MNEGSILVVQAINKFSFEEFEFSFGGSLISPAYLSNLSSVVLLFHRFPTSLSLVDLIVLVVFERLTQIPSDR